MPGQSVIVAKDDPSGGDFKLVTYLVAEPDENKAKEIVEKTLGPGDSIFDAMSASAEHIQKAGLAPGQYAIQPEKTS